MARSRGWKGRLLIAKSESHHAAGKEPQRHDSEQEPVNVRVQAADVQRACTESEQPNHAREPTDDQSGNENLLDEVEQNGEALLHLGDVVIVECIERIAQRFEGAENT